MYIYKKILGIVYLLIKSKTEIMQKREIKLIDFIYSYILYYVIL
jgi:hypothetical protein